MDTTGKRTSVKIDTIAKFESDISNKHAKL